MELRYGMISDERCKEIDSWKIRDPYGYGEIYTAERDYFVANEDESILFCLAFMPIPADRERFYETFLYINADKHYLMSYNNYNIYDEERSGEMYRIETVEIDKNEFIDKSLNKKEVLLILKELIIKKEEHSVRIPNFKRIYEFTFYYDGEEI